MDYIFKNESTEIQEFIKDFLEFIKQKDLTDFY